MEVLMFRITLFLLVTLIVTISPVVAQDAENVEEVNILHYFCDEIGAIASVENIVYVAGKYELFVVDVSDSERFRIMGHCNLQGGRYSITISGDFAYLGGNQGVVIVDVSVADDPTVIGNFETPDEVRGISVQGDYAYLAASESGLIILNISNPEEPEEIGSIDTQYEAREVTISNNLAFIADYHGGLLVVDVQGPENPVAIGRCDEFESATRVVVSGNYVYLGSRYDAGFFVVDISDPEGPVLVGQTEINVYDFKVSGDYAYIATGLLGQGLSILNIGDPENPTEAAFHEIGEWCKPYVVTLSENYAFVGDEVYGLRPIDITDPENPFDAGDIIVSGHAGELMVSGDFAYIGDRTNALVEGSNIGGGLRIVDISDPTNQGVVGYYVSEGFSNGVAVSGEYAYIVDGMDNRYGFRIIDISDPENPEEVSHLETPGETKGIDLSGEFAYLACNYAGLSIVNISNLEHPEEVGSYDTEGEAWGVDVLGGYAYIADGSEGLCIVNISDPEDPVEVAHLEIGGTAKEVIINEGIAYIVTDKLHIIDVRDRDNPEEIGSFEPDYRVASVTIHGEYAIACGVTIYHGGLSVVNIQDPADPLEVGYFTTIGHAHDVVFSTDSLIYVSEQTNIGTYRFTGWNYGLAVVSLSEGWNMMSVNVSPPMGFYADDEDRGPDIVQMMNRLRIDDENHHLVLMKNQSGRFYSPSFGFNNIPFWNLTEGYLVKVDADLEATWSGEPIPADADVPLREGWNMIAYFPTYDLDMSSPDFYGISPIIDNVIIMKDDDGRFAVPNVNFSNMPPLTEGKGYLVKVDDGDLVLNYPEQRDEGDLYLEAENYDRYWNIPVSTGLNMSLLVSVDAADGNQVAAIISDGQVVGEGVVESGRAGVAVWGDDPDSEPVEGSRTGESFRLMLWDGGRESDLSVSGFINGDALTYQTDEFIAVETIVNKFVPESFYLADPYPNPFNSTTRVTYGLPMESGVVVQVVDVTGRLVTELTDGRQSAGVHTVAWRASDAPSGVYFIRMNAGEQSISQKVVLVK